MIRVWVKNRTEVISETLSPVSLSNITFNDKGEVIKGTDQEGVKYELISERKLKDRKRSREHTKEFVWVTGSTTIVEPVDTDTFVNVKRKNGKITFGVDSNGVKYELISERNLKDRLWYKFHKKLVWVRDSTVIVEDVDTSTLVSMKWKNGRISSGLDDNGVKYELVCEKTLKRRLYDKSIDLLCSAELTEVPEGSVVCSEVNTNSEYAKNDSVIGIYEQAINESSTNISNNSSMEFDFLNVEHCGDAVDPDFNYYRENDFLPQSSIPSEADGCSFDDDHGCRLNLKKVSVFLDSFSQSVRSVDTEFLHNLTLIRLSIQCLRFLSHIFR